MSLFSLAFSLFLLIDPIGNIPFYLSILKEIELKRQRTIIIRELLIALGIIIGFTFLGNGMMDFLQIKKDTLEMTGGLILFLLSLKMIFPTKSPISESIDSKDSEPFIVPLAVPLVAGPGVLASVMIFAKQESELIMLGAILLAWGASLLILLGASLLKKILGAKGITAIERLMGLILILIAVQMFLNGVRTFLT